MSFSKTGTKGLKCCCEKQLSFKNSGSHPWLHIGIFLGALQQKVMLDL